MQWLREATALLDEGVLSQEEFNTEKTELEEQQAHAQNLPESLPVPLL